MLKKILKDNSFFYYPYLCLLFVSFIVIVTKEKGYLTITINNNHTLFFDYFFKYFTYVGTGYMLIPLVVILFFNNKTFSYLLLSTYAVNGILVFLLKRFIIYDNYRPYWFLKRAFHQVDGVEVKKLFSMPSGHSNMAFLIFLVLSFMTKSNKVLQLIFLIMATLVAISRMYLYQHFLADTVVGSAIAVVLTTLVYMFYYKKNWIE